MFYITILYFLIVLSTIINGDTVDIKILMKKPDIVNEYNSENIISSIINEFLKVNKIDSIPNIDSNIIINYYQPDSEKKYDVYNEDNSGYGDYLYNVVTGLKNSTYDMVIVDDRFLFSDYSMVKTFSIEYRMDYGFGSLHQHYSDLSEYSNTDDLKHHNRKIMNDCYFNRVDEEYNKKLYAFPYEFDFDVFYYYNDQPSLENFFTKDFSWNDLKLQSLPFLSENSTLSSPISIGLKDSDELLNYFIEYIADNYGLPYESKEMNVKSKEQRHNEYYNKFYSDSSDRDIYIPFKEYTMQFLGSNLSENLKIGVEQAFNDFVLKKKIIFKGKASHYFMKPKTVSVVLPPNGYSVINEKFLVLNNKSRINQSILKAVALKLTSPDMQLYKATKLGSIPTFNFFDQDNLDSYALSYCQTNSVICNLMKKLKPIHIKEMFHKNRYSTSFLEIQLLLPTKIKNFLLDNGHNHHTGLQSFFSHIFEAKVIPFEDLDVYTFIIYGLLSITVFAALFIMYILYKKRNHPYLKMISPNLCNLVIIGMVMSNVYPITHAHYNNVAVCKFLYVYGIVARNLIFIPTLSMMFRIYYIYTNKSKINFGKKLSNKYIYSVIGIILSVEIAVGMFIINYKEFFVVTLSKFDEPRYLYCAHYGILFHLTVIVIYYFVVVSIKLLYNIYIY